MLKVIKHYIVEIVLVVVVVIVFFMAAYAVARRIPTYDRIDEYSSMYTECMERETLSHEQCHDIALDGL